MSLACGAQPTSDVVEVVGDTTFVTSLAGPEWALGPSASIDLVIGGPDAGDEYAFGRLDPLAVSPDGGVVVYDQMYNRISRFGADGTFLGFVGASGQGPGEYDAVVSLAMTRSGGVAVQLYDGRILRYSEDGAYLSEWRTEFPLAANRTLVPVHDSLFVLKVSAPGTNSGMPATHRFVRATDTGEVLGLVAAVPTPWEDEVGRGQTSITPSRISLWSPADFALTLVSSRLAFQKAEPDGRVLRVEREYAPVRFLRDERADWETQNEFLRHRSGDASRYPPVPDHKPVIRGAFAPPNGEIWVHVSTPSVGPDPGHVPTVAGLRATPEWMEPMRMEVFNRSGRYLGSVTGPAGIDVRAVRDGMIWGYRKGAMGEQHIVRLRVDGLG